MTSLFPLFILSILGFMGAVALLALGTMLGRRPISGSCGGCMERLCVQDQDGKENRP